jgi:hypothetical protein
VQTRGERGVVYAPAGLPGVAAELGAYPRAWLPTSVPPAALPGPLRLWAGLDPARHWSGSLYLELPRRWLPAPLNFVFFDLTGRRRRLDADTARVDLLDFDAF